MAPPVEGKSRGQMKAALWSHDGMADAGRKRTAVAQWHCPDVPAVQMTNWED